ncbi:MAG: hypothetical protein PHT88_02995 [Candidatus Moranbacteria bacterium]|nr:hypothetical protein [Candidatus Moranbacteria bacterium]
MSLFSKKPLPGQSDSANNGAVIKTMQDDLDAINGVIYQEDAPLQQNPSVINQDGTHKQTFINQNPFINNEQAVDTVSSSDTYAHATPLPVSTSNISIQPQTSSSSKIIIPAIILVVLVSIGGIYYFITTRETPTEAPSIEEQIVTKDSHAIDEQEMLTLFSTETPNYLPIDANNSTPQTLQTTLLQTAKQVAALNSATPIEFIITDTNNTPIPFASFAQLSGIQLSQATLAALSENFSLFIYTSDQTPRIGLSIEFRDKNAIQAAMKQDEATLVQGLSPLFLNDTPTKTTATFSNGIYKNISLRYNNIHPETGLSVDYATTTTYLIIGTSMKTHHALLDIVR